MNKKLAASLLLAMLLAACSSKPMKDTPVAVEDKSPGMTQGADSSAADDGAATAGTADSSMSGNPLTDPSNILSKRSIYFDYDSDAVRSEYRALIEAHAKYLQQNSNTKVTLQGHADERGSREYNISLGQRRSVSVKKVMNLLGVQDSQIETVSYGEEKANTSCSDDSCYQQDRRVDIVYQGE